MRSVLMLGGVVLAMMPFVIPSEGNQIPDIPRTKAETKAYVEAWQEIVANKGGAAAYEQFAESVVDEPTAAQHSMAHFFAQALFAVNGTEAFGVCDDRFDSGCFHEFFGFRVAEDGIESAPSFLEMCESLDARRASACKHGLGHAFLAYFGYDIQGLTSSLDVCATDPGLLTMSRCYEGVFMEYTLRTMTGAESAPFAGGSLYGASREFTGNWTEHCDLIDPIFRDSCVSRLPEWWFYAAFEDASPEERFKGLGRQCSSLFSGKREQACVIGVGKKAGGESGGDPRVAAGFCDAAFLKGYDRTLCFSHAAYFFTQAQGDVRGAETICRILTDDEQRRACLVYTTSDGPSWRIQWDA